MSRTRKIVSSTIVVAVVAVAIFLQIFIINSDEQATVTEWSKVVQSNDRVFIGGDMATIAGNSGTYFALASVQLPYQEPISSQLAGDAKWSSMYVVSQTPLPGGWWKIVADNPAEDIRITITSQQTIEMTYQPFDSGDKVSWSLLMWFVTIIVLFVILVVVFC